MGCGRTVGIVSPRHISRAGGAIAWANWCRSTARSTPGSRTAARRARCWVSSIAAANLWLPGFITAYNTRFGRDPANTKDLHRPLAHADDLDEILAWREERTVTRNLTLHYDRMMLILDPTSLARGLVRKKVEVVNYPDCRFAVQFNGAALGFKVFDKIQTVQPGAIVDNKRLSAVLEQVKT